MLHSQGQSRKDTLYYYNKAKSGVMIPSDAEWFNSKSKFTSFDIDGKMLMLHFWDPFSADGLRSLAESENLQKKHPQLALMSVLRSDIPAMQNRELVNQLIQANKVNHPVITTSDYSSFGPLEFRGFPQIGMVMDEGKLVSKQYGLLPTNDLEILLDRLFKYSDEIGLDAKPFRFNKEYQVPPPKRLLNYPTSICVDSRYNRLFIADTGNDRILMISESGKLLGVIGTGTKGYRNGTFGNSQFNHPLGLAFDSQRNQLYIADALNHSIRVVDINTGVVSTCLGNGSVSVIFQNTILPGTPLNTPIGLIIEGNDLFFTMAGDDQLWKMDIRTRNATLVAGKPGGGNEDGEALNARLNSPMYLTKVGEDIYFLESSTSSLKMMDASGNVKTLLSVDSNSTTNNLMIPMGITSVNGEVYIADTYNHRIVKYQEGALTTLTGLSGEWGNKNGKQKKAKWNAPSGICSLNNQLFIVDQNNHSIRVVDTKKGRSNTLEISNYMDLLMQGNAFNDGAILMADPVGIPYGKTRVIKLNINLEPGMKWDPQGRNEVDMNDPGLNKLISLNPLTGIIEIECTNFPDNPNATLQMYLTAKDVNSGALLFRTVQVFIPFDPDGDEAEPEIEYRPFEGY
jgi:sugar lactone lactonase YvrE